MEAGPSWQRFVNADNVIANQTAMMHESRCFISRGSTALNMKIYLRPNVGIKLHWGTGS